MGHARRAPLRAPHVAGAASAADLPGIDPQAAAGLLAQRPRGASSPGPDPSMLKSVDIAAQLLLAVAERRAAAYSAFEEAFKEYAPRPGLAAEREFAAHAAAFSACQSACSAEARAAEAALRAHLGRPDLAGVVDEWQGHERVKFEQTARLQVARRAEALRAAGCCADKDCNCVVAGGAGGVAGRPDEELEAMASANEEVKREAYCALERVCEEINEAIETLKEELEDEGLGCEM